MKELELLIDNVQNMQQPVAKKGHKKSETPSPMEVLETLRQITTDFQKRLLNASKEVGCLVKHCVLFPPKSCHLYWIVLDMGCSIMYVGEYSAHTRHGEAIRHV